MEKGVNQDDTLGEAMKVAKLGYEELLSTLNSVIKKVVSKEDNCIENIKFLITALNNHPVIDFFPLSLTSLISKSEGNHKGLEFYTP